MKYTIYALYNEWGSWHYVTPLDKINKLEAWWDTDDPDEAHLPDGVFPYNTPDVRKWDVLSEGYLVFENPTVTGSFPVIKNDS